MLASADHAVYRRADPFADIHVVPPEHRAVDDELTEWARWLQMRSWSGGESPMFRLFRSSQARAAYGAMTVMPPAQPAVAQDVEEALRLLPPMSRDLLRGWYHLATPPWHLCKQLNIRKDQLAATLHDARRRLDIEMLPKRKK